MSFVKAVIGLVVSVVMVVSVLIPTFKDANTDGWSSSETTLFAMGTTFAILGVIYGVAGAFGLV